MIEGKVKCESCGNIKYEDEMSKSYKHRCKACVARLTKINRHAAIISVQGTKPELIDCCIIESAAKKRYPVPTNGNTFDKDDFEMRKLFAERQQKAYASGITDYLNGKIK
jgi:hypothetical protein